MEVLDSSRSAAHDLHAYKLTGHAGLEAGCDVSWDGSTIAYWYPREGKALNGSSIFVTGRSDRGKNGIDATRKLDRSPWVVRWMPDNRSLLILAHDGTRENMWQVSTDGNFRKLDLGDLNASGASISRGGAIALIASGPRSPTELYVMDSATAPPRRLTGFNAFASKIDLGAVARVGWRFDGFDESGVLTYPPDFVAGKKYPLVLQIHGWPQYASQEAFDTDYPGLTQLIASHGYVAFEPNYRGSDDAGNAFESAIIGDTVDGPGKDIMAGITAVEKLGFVDKSRIAVSGWSYGGLLTAWLIGRHSIWRAAVVGAAPVNEATDYAISNYNVLDRYFFAHQPWESKAAYQEYVDQSPISYAWKMQTPTLILSGVYETTVPVTHAYELFHALRERGVPVKFVAYPISEHYPSDPVLSEDVYARWVNWLDRYLR
jgi:dipeptidyl aminopeptidase/acylaminoacyl peptidase